MPKESQANLKRILERQSPPHIVYAPNYWQWFGHHQRHRRLPLELQACQTQLEMIQSLGLDVFSRNIYTDVSEYWFGPLAEVYFEGITYHSDRQQQSEDRITVHTYETAKGTLTEQLRFVVSETTVVQDKFVIDDYASQLQALELFVKARRWRFNVSQYQAEQERVGEDGLVIAGELFSPLKMLHLLMGPVNTIYLVTDYPELVDELCAIHEESQLDLARQMAEAGVPAMMAMDNLDTAFHPPPYVERFSASFYEKASQICHEHGSTFFIHACGQQRDNLKRISALGVDGLEGLSYPPLGDISLVEAMEMSGDRFIITGGISAAEFQTLQTREHIFDYVRLLIREMWPYRHRFILSASCNTPINASYEQIKWFQEAWLMYKDGERFDELDTTDLKGRMTHE